MKRFALAVLLLSACKSGDKPTETPADKPAETKPEPKPPAPPLPKMDASGFAKDCKEATDCVIARVMSCDPCGCPSDAIASKEMAKFDAAADKLNCPPPDLDMLGKCTPCVPKTAACENNLCVAK
ncbi:hypothetical protein BH11MYX2_BH11MYX2_02980 [soil metagenome]